MEVVLAIKTLEAILTMMRIGKKKLKENCMFDDILKDELYFMSRDIPFFFIL